jgi:beta-lactamase regulating signal transducer with metallopeptidase domain
MILAVVLNHLPEKRASLRYELSSFALFLVFISSLCTFIGQLDQQTIMVAETILIQEVSDTSSPLNPLASPTYYSVLIWLFGFILLSLRLLMGWLNLLHLRYRSQSVLGWQKTALIAMKKRMKITVKIGLVESPLINIPATIGYLKPIILLPLSSTILLTPDQLQAVIAHVLAHIK